MDALTGAVCSLHSVHGSAICTLPVTAARPRRQRAAIAAAFPTKRETGHCWRDEVVGPRDGGADGPSCFDPKRAWTCSIVRQHGSTIEMAYAPPK